MFKKIISLTLAVLVALMPMHSQAVDLSGTFNNLMASGSAVGVNSPGSFTSQARTGFTGGGVEVRVPRQSGTPSLLSITPTKIQAGCNGISAHFGGFSFISAQAFGDLLKKIASGAALGFVTSLVMKTLCPPCEAIVQELKTAAADAAKLARNSCQWGQEQGKAFRASLQETMDKSQMCATNEESENGSTDSLAAWAGLCSTTEKAVDAMKERAGVTSSGSETDKAKENSLLCDVGAGNLTWMRLSAFDSSAESDEDTYKRKLLLLNILGAAYSRGGEADEVTCEYKNKDTPKSSTTLANGTAVGYCTPQSDTKMLSSLFLCGAPDANGEFANDPTKKISSRVREYCKSQAGKPDTVKGTYQVWTCDEPVGCKHMRLTDPSVLVSGEGFIVSVNKLLLKAVDRVRTNAGFDDPEGQAIIKLIQVAPYPLYQAINAAAVYPAAAQDLLDSMSILVGEQFAYALLDETLTVTNRVSSTVCPMSQEQATAMLGFINSFRVENKNRMSSIASNLVAQQAITRQIQEINQAIQQQVLSEDMLSTGRLAESINHTINFKGKPKQ